MPSRRRPGRMAARRRAAGAAGQRPADGPHGARPPRGAARRPTLGEPPGGDPGAPAEVLARRLAALGERPSAAREAGLTVVQLLQFVSEAQGRGRGERDVAILFTDLVDFSPWALEVGDAVALRLLAAVGTVVEGAVPGDTTARSSSAWATGSWRRSATRRPRCTPPATPRPGSTLRARRLPAPPARRRARRPARRLGRDYLGVDVNIAARVVDASRTASWSPSRCSSASTTAEFEARRRLMFSAKGIPEDLRVFWSAGGVRTAAADAKPSCPPGPRCPRYGLRGAPGRSRAHPAGGRALDAESSAWLRSLDADGPARDEAVARLHALLLRAAHFEVVRRRTAVAHVRGEELEDLAMQAADDALVAVLAKRDQFRGESRFTTWAYKFALLEASVKVRRRAWQHREVPLEPEALGARARPPALAPEAAPRAASCSRAVAAARSRRAHPPPARGPRRAGDQRRPDRRPRRAPGHHARRAVQDPARRPPQAARDARGRAAFPSAPN